MGCPVRWQFLSAIHLTVILIDVFHFAVVLFCILIEFSLRHRTRSAFDTFNCEGVQLLITLLQIK